MRAYEIREFGIKNLGVVGGAGPREGGNEVLVRFRAASLNYRDLMVVSGTYNPRMKLPAVPLSDGAGEVAAIGGSVTLWKPGDRVMPLFVQRWYDGRPTDENRRTALGAGSQWDGVLREFATFDERSVVRIPEHLTFEEAATLPCTGVTAWNALFHSGKLKPGETVLIQGSGGISVFALQFAKMAGARVFATSGSDSKIGRLNELGADATVNYRKRAEWDKAAQEFTPGGVDHVIEVGGSGTLSRSVNAVRVGGHIAMIGALAEEKAFSPINLFMRSIRLQGIFVGSKTMFEEMNQAISAHHLRPVIDRVFGFEEVRDALSYMREGSHVGKIVVKIG